MQDDASTGSSDRVADGDGTAIDVETFLRNCAKRSRQVKLLTLNLLGENYYTGRVSRYLRQTAADIVVLEENTPYWSEKLVELRDLYPYTWPEILPFSSDVLVLSRHFLAQHATRYGNALQGTLLDWRVRPTQDLRGRTVHVLDVGSRRSVDRFYRQAAKLERMLVAAFERESEWRPETSESEGADRA